MSPLRHPGKCDEMWLCVFLRVSSMSYSKRITTLYAMKYFNSCNFRSNFKLYIYETQKSRLCLDIKELVKPLFRFIADSGLNILQSYEASGMLHALVDLPKDLCQRPSPPPRARPRPLSLPQPVPPWPMFDKFAGGGASMIAVGFLLYKDGSSLRRQSMSSAITCF